MNREVLRQRFERATEVPLLVLALAVIPLLLAPVLLDLSEAVEQAILVADWFIWAAFAFEFAVRLALSVERRRYVVEHWLDLIIVVVPFLRPLRVARSARALRLLGLSRVAALIARATRDTRRVLGRRGLQYAAVLGLAAILGAAGVVTAFERNAQGANIHGFGDSLWWAATTVTTVGYGDRFPVTAEGRGVGVFLMLVGITLFSLLTANIAAFFVESDEEGTRAALEELRDEVRQLRLLLTGDEIRQ